MLNADQLLIQRTKVTFLFKDSFCEFNPFICVFNCFFSSNSFFNNLFNCSAFNLGSIQTKTLYIQSRPPVKKVISKLLFFLQIYFLNLIFSFVFVNFLFQVIFGPMCCLIVQVLIHPHKKIFFFFISVIKRNK